MSLSRKTELKRTGWKRPAKGTKLFLPEKPTSRHPRPSGPSLDVVQLVLARDGGLCVVCGIELFGTRSYDWSIHHRRGRDGKPDSNRPQNLISVCGADNVTGCHGRIHKRRSESQPNGWWISRIKGPDPLVVPLLIHRESMWVYLTDDGGYADAPPEVAA